MRGVKTKFLDSARVVWVAGSNLYFAFFFVWFALSMLTRGRFAWVSLANMFAFPIFLLALPCALAGIIYRRRSLLLAAGLTALLFGWMFGNFFLPKGQSALASSGALKVMTYNMLSFSPNPSAVLKVIQAENADIVFMQEINPQTADLLQSEMRDSYPYQIHDPSEIPVGLSVISKYPFTPLATTLPSTWVGKPILLEVDWRGQKIAVVNFHMVPTPLVMIVVPKVFKKIMDIRKEEADTLVNFAQAKGMPVIIAGDMNDVFLNDPYSALTNAGLQDTWAEAGFGLGHTFPGNKSPGTSRLHAGDIYVPEWLVRIDYIFATPEWEIVSAQIAPTDGYSDHRPVTATLRLR